MLQSRHLLAPCFTRTGGARIGVDPDSRDSSWWSAVNIGMMGRLGGMVESSDGGEDERRDPVIRGRGHYLKKSLYKIL